MKDLITDAKSTFGDDEDEEYETPLKVERYRNISLILLGNYSRRWRTNFK